jgi:hypothetical protein
MEEDLRSLTALVELMASELCKRMVDMENENTKIAGTGIISISESALTRVWASYQKALEDSREAKGFPRGEGAAKPAPAEIGAGTVAAESANAVAGGAAKSL